MLEILLNPKKAERKTWELFFIGFFYAAVSLIMVNWLFSGNPIFSKHMSILTITFTVMLSIPFMYYTIKMEEEREAFEESKIKIFKGHAKAISAFLWLFMGFVVAFSMFYILFPSFIGENFQTQIEQYCSMNMPFKTDECISRAITANALNSGGKVIDILTNNLYVMFFCIIFSLVFGAGAIFILAWNATVIATAIGIFSRSSISNMPLAIGRYMLHGLPEIAAYFTAALAGGIISVGLIRYDLKDSRFWNVLTDSIGLIVISVGILIIAALMEVFITPRFF